MLSNTSLLFLLFLATLIPQSSAQAPQSAQTPELTQSGVTLRAGTQLVVVDVVVTDKSQNPINNLKASDFTLLEGGKPQQIKSFEEHTVRSTKPVPAMPVFPPGIFSNYTPVPAGGAVNILLVDTLNTPALDQIRLHDQSTNT